MLFGANMWLTCSDYSRSTHTRTHSRHPCRKRACLRVRGRALSSTPRPHSLLHNYVYKTAGAPPREATQAIPAEWAAAATPHRRRLFARLAGTKPAGSFAAAAARL